MVNLWRLLRLCLQHFVFGATQIEAGELQPEKEAGGLTEEIQRELPAELCQQCFRDRRVADEAVSG